MFLLSAPKEERASCFTLIVLLLPCGCLCPGSSLCRGLYRGVYKEQEAAHHSSSGCCP